MFSINICTINAIFSYTTIFSYITKTVWHISYQLSVISYQLSVFFSKIPTLRVISDTWSNPGAKPLPSLHAWSHDLPVCHLLQHNFMIIVDRLASRLSLVVRRLPTATDSGYRRVCPGYPRRRRLRVPVAQRHQACEHSHPSHHPAAERLTQRGRLRQVVITLFSHTLPATNQALPATNQALPCRPYGPRADGRPSLRRHAAPWRH